MRARARSYRAAALVAAATLSFLAPPLDAYNQSGHMETVRLVVEKSLKPAIDAAGARMFPMQLSEQKLVEFCAQLPDLSQELDATRTYIAAVGQVSAPITWISWGWFNHPMNDDYRRMIAVQQLQHALTGGNTAAMRRVAASAVATLFAEAAKSDPDSDRTVALCALGLAFHLYGDSFAHTQMSWSKTDIPVSLYATGRGHAYDGHYPDYILCNYFSKSQSGDTDCHHSSVADSNGVRFGAWIAYWTRIEGVIIDVASPRTLLTAMQTDDVFAQSPADIMANVRRSVLLIANNTSNTEQATDIATGKALRNALDSSPNTSADSKNFDAALEALIEHSTGTLGHAPACRGILTNAASTLSLGDKVVHGSDNCAKVWDMYSKTVISLLQKCDSPGQKLDMPECNDGHSEDHNAVDSSWEKWLQSGDLNKFARLVQFK